MAAEQLASTSRSRLSAHARVPNDAARWRGRPSLSCGVGVAHRAFGKYDNALHSSSCVTPSDLACVFHRASTERQLRSVTSIRDLVADAEPARQRDQGQLALAKRARRHDRHRAALRPSFGVSLAPPEPTPIVTALRQVRNLRKSSDARARPAMQPDTPTNPPRQTTRSRHPEWRIQTAAVIASGATRSRGTQSAWRLLGCFVATACRTTGVFRRPIAPRNDVPPECAMA